MKYIIIGAVAGGASTAARLRRLDESAEILLIEKGEYISFANCGLPYYIGDVIQDRNKLLIQTAQSFKARFNIEVFVNTEAININKEDKTIELMDLNSGKKRIEQYDKLVLSTGASAITPPFPGIQLPGIFTIRNMKDTDMVKEMVEKMDVKHATVIGAGFIGLEMIENFHHLGISTTLIERANQILPPVDANAASFAMSEFENKNISIHLGTSVASFSKSAENRILVETDNTFPIETDLVILSIGVKPNSKLAVSAGLELGKNGGILVNSYLQTSHPSIYAVGDVIEFKNKLSQQVTPTYLAGPANKQGRICANNIVNNNIEKYEGSINTAIVKLFEKTIATTGLSERQLKEMNIPYVISTNFGGSNAGYYPGSEQLMIQIAFNPENGTLLGGQIAGTHGVDKRIDVLSNLIQQGKSIYELMDFEHAYAPPFSSAKDPLNMAGFIAENILQGRQPIFYPTDIDSFTNEDYLLDVRTEEENSKGKIPNSTLIPLDEIRKNLKSIPKDKTIYVHCETGLRGYLAVRILLQNGFKAKNLSGGYQLWKLHQKSKTVLNKRVLEVLV